MATSLSPRPERFTITILSDAAGSLPRLRGEPLAHLDGAGEGVGGLDGGDDALGAAQEAEGLHGFAVRDGLVADAADVREVGVLRADAGVVQAGRDGVRLDGLAVVVLHEVGAGAVQHAGLAERDGGRVAAGFDAVAAGLEAVDLDRGVIEEAVEDADRVGAAADAGADGVRAAGRSAPGSGRGLPRR